MMDTYQRDIVGIPRRLRNSDANLSLDLATKISPKQCLNRSVPAPSLFLIVFEYVTIHLIKMRCSSEMRRYYCSKRMAITVTAKIADASEIRTSKGHEPTYFCE
jgi:hypothetical protein